jgi:hypothetical protein
MSALKVIIGGQADNSERRSNDAIDPELTLVCPPSQWEVAPSFPVGRVQSVYEPVVFELIDE